MKNVFLWVGRHALAVWMVFCAVILGSIFVAQYVVA